MTFHAVRGVGWRMRFLAFLVVFLVAAWILSDTSLAGQPGDPQPVFTSTSEGARCSPHGVLMGSWLYWVCAEGEAHMSPATGCQGEPSGDPQDYACIALEGHASGWIYFLPLNNATVQVDVFPLVQDVYQFLVGLPWPEPIKGILESTYVDVAPQAALSGSLGAGLDHMNHPGCTWARSEGRCGGPFYDSFDEPISTVHKHWHEIRLHDCHEGHAEARLDDPFLGGSGASARATFMVCVDWIPAG